MIANLNIPSLGIKYPVLSSTSTALLKISLNKYWGTNPNEVGNMCIVGHNYEDSRFFGKLNKIKKGAIVKITDLTLDHNTEILPEMATEKLSRVDVLARLGDGTLVDIEIQSREKGFKEKRCLQYWSRLYSQDIEKGKDYLQLNKTICIWIVDSTVYEEFKEYESTWKVQETRYGVKGHFEDFEMHVIELQKFRNTDIIKPSKREFWLWFIDHTKKELVEMSVRDMKEVEKAYEEYKRITSDKGLMNAIINMDMAEMDRAQEITDAIAEGESRGKEKGKEESKIEIAKKMLEANMDIKQICEFTELTVEEVEKLKEEK